MGVTIFDLKPKHKTKVQKQPTEQLVELERIVVKHKPSYMSYIDSDNKEKTITGGFSKKSDGTYVLTKTTVEKCELFEKTTYTYKDVDAHFTYIDNDGKQRTFNKLDTLKYDEESNSYTGVVGNIEYEETEVELISKE